MKPECRKVIDAYETIRQTNPDITPEQLLARTVGATGFDADTIFKVLGAHRPDLALGHLGATHTHSQGKIREDDEGDIRMAIAADHERNIIIIDYGSPVKWLGLPPEDAINYAKTILRNVEKLTKGSKG